jgi:hypothetical protein
LVNTTGRAGHVAGLIGQHHWNTHKFPPELSAEIIINGLLSRSEDYPEIEVVRICVGTQDMKSVFVSTLAAKTSSPA